MGVVVLKIKRSLITYHSPLGLRWSWRFEDLFANVETLKKADAEVGHSSASEGMGDVKH